jgi:hypothetical protein
MFKKKRIIKKSEDEIGLLEETDFNIPSSSNYGALKGRVYIFLYKFKHLEMRS